jgi:plastocyanin
MPGMNRTAFRPKRLMAAVVALASMATLVACGSDQPAGAGSPSPSPTGHAQHGSTVTQRTFKFLPPSLSVEAGAEVTWVNEDTVDHTITSGTPGGASGEFDEPLDKKATVVIPFAEPGTFAYFCSTHPSMTGEILVG